MDDCNSFLNSCTPTPSSYFLHSSQSDPFKTLIWSCYTLAESTVMTFHHFSIKSKPFTWIWSLLTSLNLLAHTHPSLSEHALILGPFWWGASLWNVLPTWLIPLALSSVCSIVISSEGSSWNTFCKITTHLLVCSLAPIYGEQRGMEERGRWLQIVRWLQGNLYVKLSWQLQDELITTFACQNL